LENKKIPAAAVFGGTEPPVVFELFSFKLNKKVVSK
jgi:hypothetical protein